MFVKNILNFIIAGLLLVIAALYFSKESFNHSGPQENIWNIEPVSPGTLVSPAPETPTSPAIFNNYDEALAEAKKNNKRMLLVFGADWCNWCKKFKNETLKNESVKRELVENNIIEVHINTDQKRELAKKYRVRGIPAYSLVDKDEKELRNGSGFKNPDDFIAWLSGQWGKNAGVLNWIFGL